MNPVFIRRKIPDSQKYIKIIIKIILVLIVLYAFLFSIRLMGSSFKLFGEDFAQQLISITSNPFVGLMIGILATSLIQSSSTTTALVVGLVAGGTLSLGNAIPIVMGANIGTTVTNTIVSIAHIKRRGEFKRAFAGSIVHDIFNIMAVMIFFPIELKFHLIEKSAIAMTGVFVGIGGIKMFNPLKLIIDPLINVVEQFIQSPIIMIVMSFVILFSSMILLVKIMRSMVMTKMKILLDHYLFKNDRSSFGMGMLFTATVQSSSISTSLVIPLVGSGLLKVKQIFPYTLGTNIGTTVTAILASLATANPIAITVAFAHLLFNIFGIIIIYPFRKLPIWLAESLSAITTKSKRNTLIFLFAYFLLYFIPIVFILFR